MCQLGANNGPGFGWNDMTVFKLGLSYAYSQNLTLRGGFSTTNQPISKSQTLFNMLAPGVIENHLTLGATWATSPSIPNWTVSYMHGFSKKVNGSGSISLVGFGGWQRQPEDAPGFAGHRLRHEVLSFTKILHESEKRAAGVIAAALFVSIPTIN